MLDGRNVAGEVMVTAGLLAIQPMPESHEKTVTKATYAYSKIEMELTHRMTSQVLR